MKPPKPIAAEKSQLQLFQARLDSQLKGKDRIRYEFGNKAAVVSTNNRNWIVNVEDLSDNPYDGHTLAVSISGAEKLTKNAVSEANVDKGCRGHDYKGDA